MVPTEKLLLGRLVVSYRTVKLGSELEMTGPVLGDEMCLERGEMRVCHRDEASFEHRGPTPRTILDRESAHEKPARKIECRTPRLDNERIRAKPWPALDGEGQ